jgi:hypothetical protein
MITEKLIRESEPGDMLACGVAHTSFPSEAIKWVAVRGEIADWAVYTGPIGESLGMIKDRGAKVYNIGTVRKWTEATNDAIMLYRDYREEGRPMP